MARDTNKYIFKGVRYPSVTEIIRIAGLVDFSHVDPVVLETARQRGQYVASYIEDIETGVVTPEEEPCAHKERIDAYRRWRDDFDFQVIGAEGVVADHELGYAGTLDLFGTIRGGIKAVIDVKASYSLPVTTGIQCAAYAHALSAGGHEGEIKIYGLHLQPPSRSNKSGFLFKEYDFYPSWEMFYAAMGVAKWKLKHKMASI